MNISTRIKYLINRMVNRKPVINLQVHVATMPTNELLKGRCALITGGTSGIGYSIAEAFLNAGCSVIITGRSQGRIDEAKSHLLRVARDSHVYGCVLNNTDIKSFNHVFNSILEVTKADKIYPVDILVNNAGVNCNTMPSATEEEYDIVMDTNLKGTYFLSQIFSKYLIENKIRGNILNIASASSLRPANSAYVLSKWGMRSLTMGLAKSLAEHGITVNGIAPGPTATPMMIKNDQTNMALDRLPLGRYIMPEEISNMAVVLVSDMGKSIIGDIIYMTGGAGNLTYDDVKYSF